MPPYKTFLSAFLLHYHPKQDMQLFLRKTYKTKRFNLTIEFRPPVEKRPGPSHGVQTGCLRHRFLPPNCHLRPRALRPRYSCNRPLAGIAVLRRPSGAYAFALTPAFPHSTCGGNNQHFTLRFLNRWRGLCNIVSHPVRTGVFQWLNHVHKSPRA